MQRYTIFFIAVNDLYVSGGFSARHQELKTVHTASGICQVCLLLPVVVAASKLRIYQVLRVQFELLMMCGKPPETYRALTAIKNTVQRCILLDVLKRIHNMYFLISCIFYFLILVCEGAKTQNQKSQLLGQESNQVLSEYNADVLTSVYI